MTDGLRQGASITENFSHQKSSVMAARHKVTNILLKITAKIEAGEKICVVGNSRSGKSLFLLSILDETEMSGGEIRMNGRVSF